MALHLRPVSLGEANEFVTRLHRHHPKMPGWKFGLGVEDNENELRGVIMVGHPFARRLDDGWTLEVTRCCTDGAKNAPSLLYSAAWRIGRDMGYSRMITYTLETESGISLRASGWMVTNRTEAGAGNWANRPNRGKGAVAQFAKLRWEPRGSCKTSRPPLRRTASFRKNNNPSLLFDFSEFRDANSQ
jgi:hypothetical protein